MASTMTPGTWGSSQSSDKEIVLPGKVDAQAVQKVNDLFDRAKKDRWKFERQWYSNLAFYFGRQWVAWKNGGSPELNQMYEPPAPAWRVRLVSNRIRPLIRNELSKIVKEKPSCFVIPSSTEDDDIMAARAGEAIFEHLWRTMHMERTVRRSQFWNVITGNAFIKDWWDPNQPDYNEEVKGRICAEPVTPFHLFAPDLQEEDIENQPYIIQVSAKSPDWVHTVYGKEVAADSHAGVGVLEQQFLSAIGVENTAKDYVAVKEAWIRPCRDYPDGAMIAIANDTLLARHDGWIFQHGEYPYTKFGHIPTGRFYTDSSIPDLIPLQKEFNRTRSQIIEAKNRMAKPQLLAPRGSVDPNKITSEPGLIIQYTPGFTPPTPLPLTALPAYVIQELERNITDMSDIVGQHEISKGQTPPGVTAATAISFLQEQDDTMLAGTIQSMEEGVEKIGRHFLSHVNEYWTAERKVRVVGDNGLYETFLFTQKSIKQNTDLKIEAGSAMPRSRAAKQAFIMELGKLGWIDPNRAMRYLDMAETGRLYEEMQTDMRHAQRENLRMAVGEQVPINNWDEHSVHIQEHNNYRKKQEYETLDPIAQQLFEAHVQEHQLRLGLPGGMTPEQMVQQQALGTAPGSVPGAGGGAPPGLLGPGSGAPGAGAPPPQPPMQ